MWSFYNRVIQMSYSIKEKVLVITNWIIDLCVSMKCLSFTMCSEDKIYTYS